MARRRRRQIHKPRVPARENDLRAARRRISRAGASPDRLWRGLTCRSQHVLAAVLLLLLPLLVGCDRGTAGNGGDPAAQSTSHRVEEGPVQATVTLSPREVRTSGSMRLVVDVTAPAGARVEEIALDGALPRDWVITDRRRAARSAGAGQRSERFEFTIEPYLPGRHEIASFEIICDVKGDAGERIALHSIAVPVEVVSEWPAGDSSRQPASLREVVEAPRRPWAWWIWTGLAGGVALLLAAAAWLVARARRPVMALPVYRTAHEIALIDLGRLIAEQLIERGLCKTFYQRLSNILRRYIENRFGLRAPERTTEEFLDESRHAQCFGPGDLALLEEFLTHCDLVKFAEFRPDAVRMNESLDTVRAFIERTRSDDSLVEVRPDGQTHAVEAAA